jgi:hypothetical protein
MAAPESAVRWPSTLTRTATIEVAAALYALRRARSRIDARSESWLVVLTQLEEYLREQGYPVDGEF